MHPDTDPTKKGEPGRHPKRKGTDRRGRDGGITKVTMTKHSVLPSTLFSKEGEEEVSPEPIRNGGGKNNTVTSTTSIMVESLKRQFSRNF